MKKRLYLLIPIIVCCGSMFSLNAQQRYGLAKVKITYDSVRSNVLGETRKISIYKPEVFPEYAEAVSPVIYVLDGEFYTDYVSTMINLMCERFVTMPPIIVVGIENIGREGIGRNRDMTPLVAKDSSIFKTSGGAENFIKFIREELFPFVEKDHKKTPYRVIVGHSLGGLLVMHSFLKHPGMFNAYLASDPSMWMDQNAYMPIPIEAINKMQAYDGSLFMSTVNNPSLVTNARKVDSLFKSRSPKGLSYKFMEYPREDHLTVCFKSYYEGFRFFFQMDPPEYDKQPGELTYELFEKHYQSLSRIFGYNMKPPENVVNNFGYLLLMSSEVDKALEFFKKNVENYPNSANVYDSYGEAFLKKGDKKNAMINYDKAFQMDPTNTAARDIVNKLKNEK